MEENFEGKGTVVLIVRLVQGSSSTLATAAASAMKNFVANGYGIAGTKK